MCGVCVRGEGRLVSMLWWIGGRKKIYYMKGVVRSIESSLWYGICICGALERGGAQYIDSVLG